MDKRFFKKLFECSKKSKSGQFYMIIKSKNAELLGNKVYITDDEMIFSNENTKDQVLSMINSISVKTNPEIYKINDEISIFSEFISSKPTIVLCGGGHVSKCVYKFAIMLGFDVLVIDDREEFANFENFPKASGVICSDFETAINDIQNDNIFYVVVTRGHVHDGLCVSRILNKKYKYLGMIGSKRKVSIIKNYLEKEGFSKEKIAEINAPIGLDIGAETPEEIAVSIMAEIISYRRKEKIESYLDDEIIEFIANTKSQVSLSMILEKSGSIPRGPGAKMAVTKNGELIGSIGGGAIEYEAKLQCMKFEDLHAKTYNYSMHNSDASKEGMSCGGDALVYIENLK